MYDTQRSLRRALGTLAGGALLVASATGTAQSEAAEGVQEIGYELRLAELEERVNELKEDIFRSKSRLFLLREQILQNAVGGSRAFVSQSNHLGRLFLVSEVFYSLDGEQVYAGFADEGALEDQFVVYDGPILPGPHNLTVEVRLEGNPFGVFSYMEEFSTTLSAAHQFTVDEGQTVRIDVQTRNRSGLNHAPEDAADLRFEVTTERTQAAGLGEEEGDE